MTANEQKVVCKRQRGFTILELMIATVVATVMIIGLSSALTYAIQANMFRDDRTLSFKSSHQTLETLMSLDLDTMLLQDGNTFTIGTTDNPLKTQSATGTITITDVGWEGNAGQAYQITVKVSEFNVELSTVRTRY